MNAPIMTFLRQLALVANEDASSISFLVRRHREQLQQWCGNLDVVNPSDPGLQAMEGHWEKIAILLMQKMHATKITISEKDIAAMSANGVPFIVLDSKERNAIHLCLFKSEEEALAYVAERQGRG